MKTNVNYDNYFKLILVLLALISCFQIGSLGLIYDEAYYWIYSKFPAFGYYDHPPMVGWLIYLGSLFGHHEFWVRVPFLSLTIVGFIYLYKLVPRLGLPLFSLLILSFPLFHGVSFLALPDTGQFVFGIMYFYYLKKYIEHESSENSLTLGVVIALLLYSKYHGILLVFFTLLAMPGLFKRKSFWIVFIAALLTFLPHILWQYQHEFISIKFHLTKRSGRGFKIKNVLEYLGSLLILGGGFASAYYFKLLKKPAQNLFQRILKFNIVGLLIFFFLTSIKGKSEANWTLNLYPLLIIWASYYAHAGILKRLSYPIIICIIALRILIQVDDGKVIERIGEFERWDEISKSIKKYCQDLPIVANSYQFAAKSSFYLNEMVPALHIYGRKSQFDLLKLEERINNYQRVCYLSDNNSVGAQEIMVKYKEPIYVQSANTLNYWLEQK